MDTSLQKYQAFVATVDTGSFSKAAETLNYSQSGISRMIGDLENEWNVTLLERGKAGVKLTSDGTKLLPYARNLIRDFESLRHAIDGLAGLESGLIRLGAHLGVSRKRLAKLISDFSKECPGIDLEIKRGSYDQIETWLTTGQIDIGLTRLPASFGLETYFVSQEQLLAVSSQPLGIIAPIADFNDENFILYELGAQNDVSALLKKCKVTPNIRLISQDYQEVLELVAAGQGSAILQEGLCEDLPDKVYTAPLDVPAFISTGFALRSKRSASVATRKFLEVAGL